MTTAITSDNTLQRPHVIKFITYFKLKSELRPGLC